jgi:tripartite-type tricarboxylate transporter receptor subunit TctC
VSQHDQQFSVEAAVRTLNSLLKALGFVAALLIMPSQAALAQNFPTRTVTIIVPYPAGGGTDTVARSLARALSGRWNQPVIVENISGADGLIGTNRMLQLPADGHTILVAVNQMLLWPSTMPTVKIDIQKSFRLITKLQNSPMAFGTSTKFPGNTLKDFLGWCKSAASPCTVGAATAFGNLMGRQLMDLERVGSAVFVPYKGTAPMMTDVLGGHVTMGLPSTAFAMPHIQRGTFKILAVGSRKRFPLLPDVPTLAEQGYNVNADTWYGMMVAKDTPQPVFDAIVSSVKAVSKDPALLASIHTNGGQPIFNSPEEFEVEVQQERQLLEPIMIKYPLNK